MLGRLFSHASWYTVGNLLATLAGFVSFPLLARAFTVEEYGVLSLISVTLLLLVGLAKSGVQHAVVRFYGEVQVGGDVDQIRKFQATVLYGISFTSLLIMLFWVPVSQLLPEGLWRDARVSSLLLITAVLVVVRAIDSAFINLLRAQERSTAYSLYQITKKYLGLTGTVVVLWWLSGGLTEYYFAVLATEILAVLGLAVFIFQGQAWLPRDFDPKIYRAMMAFGIPMIGYELMGIVLNAGDRYVIGWFSGNGAVGVYSAAYNLCEYIEGIFIVSVAQAIQPMYVKLWKNKGEEATEGFLRNALHLYIAGGTIVAAGFSAIGPEIITLLASEKYLAGSAIIPMIIVGMVLRGSMVIFGAGIYIHLQTKMIMLMVSSVALLNLALNFLLVPRFGIVGAAVATSFSCLVLSVGVYSIGSKWLKVRIPWGLLAKYVCIGATMYVLLGQLALNNPWLNLVCKVMLGAGVSISLALILDGEIRRWTKHLLDRWRIYRIGQPGT